MLTESLKSYLRAIYFINHTKPKIRVKDIASFLNVRSASVTEALTALVDEELITHQPYRDIKMTKKGYQITQDILHQQRALFDFLYGILGLTDEDAHRVVSRIGDTLSIEAVMKLNTLVARLQKEEKLLSDIPDNSTFKSPCSTHERCTMCRYYLNHSHHAA